jgi:hypothetical protein
MSDNAHDPHCSCCGSVVFECTSCGLAFHSGEPFRCHHAAHEHEACTSRRLQRGRQRSDIVALLRSRRGVA